MAQSNMTSSTLGAATVKLSGFVEISATAFTGPLTGAVTGSVTGKLTGDSIGTATGTIKCTNYIKMGTHHTLWYAS